MSEASSSDTLDHRLTRGQLYSHDLQLDNSEWPDSNTFSQLSPVSSDMSVIELSTKLKADHFAPVRNSVHPKLKAALPESRSDSSSRADIDDAQSIQSNGMDCADSLTADTDFVQPGAIDPFGASSR